MSIDPFTGRNPSYCFVDMSSAENTQAVMAVLQGQMVRGRPAKINFDTGKRSRDHRRPIIVYDESHRPRQVPPPNVLAGPYAFDRWSRTDAESHWTAPMEEHRRLCVGGLPRIPGQGVVNLEMRGLFQGYEVQAVSKIISPSAATRQRGGSRYYCFVDLPTPEDAENAIRELDGKRTPYGGQYEVSLARQRRPTKVQREQLGVSGDSSPEQQKPHRDLASSWRRVE